MAEIKKQYSLIEFDRSEDYIAYKSFRDVFFSATREQQDFFLNNCLDDKTFSHEARLMMQDIINGKDPRGILPELNLEKSDKQPYEMPPLSAEDRIHEAMLEHMKGWTGHDRALIKGEWAQQGWTLNIAANDMEDYARKCEVLLPELNKMGVSFSIVKPCDFEQYKTGENRNQFITIYGGPNLDFTKLSPEAQAVLHEPSDGTVHGNMQIDGCLFCRYGTIGLRTNDNALITNPNGYLEADWRDPRIAYPSFITFNKNDVLNFYSQSEQKFAQTGDYRAFLQERETMAFCDGYNYAYATFKINQQDIGKVQAALSRNDTNTSLSFVTSHDVSDGRGGTQKEYLLMTHKSAMTAEFTYQNGQHAFNSFNSPLLQDLVNQGVNLERPEWDYRGDAFIVPNNSTPQLEELCSRTAGLGAYIGTTENGTAFIQCDTMFVDTLKDSLENEFNLPFSVYDPTLENDARDFVNQMFDYGQKGEISMDEIIQGFTMGQGDFEPDIAE